MAAAGVFRLLMKESCRASTAWTQAAAKFEYNRGSAAKKLAGALRPTLRYVRHLTGL